MFTGLVAISILQRLAMVPVMYWLLWFGSFALSIASLVLLRTRWGQSRPFQKCAVLSLLVHALLACLAMTVRVVVGDGGGGAIGAPIRVRILEDAMDSIALNLATTDDEVNAAPALFEPPAAPPETPAEDEAAAREEVLSEVATESPEPLEAQALDTTETLAELEPTIESEQQSQADEPSQTSSNNDDDVAAITSNGDINPPTERDAAPSIVVTPPVVSDSIEPAASESASPPAAAPPAPSTTSTYALRSNPGRLGLIELQGGNAQTEGAVVAALAWLARAQSADGRWDANRFGAGQEQSVLGHNRGGAGRSADTGVSALGILAFLGAGHSHQQGDYPTTVRRGLDFLARSQAADGSLFGNATLYAQMYCHSMATFALAEAQAMTGDARWQSAVVKAIGYSLRAQHPVAGGWRYRPGDTGDTSQLGWQLMALASAERAGIKIPPHSWTRARQFLISVKRGSYGGLAAYRVDGPHSTSMTAEALYCRLLLEDVGHDSVDDPAVNEATRQLLAALPNSDRLNLYYWYYATLALHHRHEANAKATEAWTTWNEALTTVLIDSQLTDGPHAGSWNTDTVWGGYGGRVYTTAMAAMCLEAYYRYAPAAPRQGWTATRPGASDLSR